RAAVGLAWQLRQWEQAAPGAPEVRVEPVARQMAALVARRRLRGVWQSPERRAAELPLLAPMLDLPVAKLARLVEQAPCYGALWDDLQTERQQRLREGDLLQPISTALQDLRREVRQASRGQGASSSGGAVPALSNTSMR
ncbi:MAG: hypothetical protein ABIN96_06890, partial [Rubrivivax sp.]